MTYLGSADNASNWTARADSIRLCMRRAQIASGMSLTISSRQKKLTMADSRWTRYHFLKQESRFDFEQCNTK